MKLFQELKAYKGFYLMIVIVPLVAVLASLLIVTYGIRTKETNYETQLNYGYASLEAQAYDEAIAAFENAYRIDNTYDAALGLAKAWYHSGDAQKAVQVLTARSELYEHTEEMDALITEYNISMGIYPTVTIGGKEIETNTTTIYIRNVTLTEEDKQALAGFTDMVTLDLTNCGLTDIEFLRNCNKLMSVTLTENPISDFTPLYGMPDLRTLYINDTAITDYSQLHSMTNLTLLNANGNWITSDAYDALDAALPHCELYAGLNGYLIKNLSFAGLDFTSDVTELDLSGRSITDVTPLKECNVLETLNLSNNKISWITPMEELYSLVHLNFSENRLSNISALEGLSRLSTLNLENNKVTDLKPLAGKTSLTELNLNGNPIYHGHEALSTLTGLQKLSLQNAMIQDKHLTLLPMGNLTELDLRNNKQLTEATVLDFVAAHPGCTIYTDFGPADVTLGEKTYSATEASVDASYSSVIDLSPVSQFTGVSTLNLAGNGISDFAPLKDLTSLTALNLQSTGLTDCSSLSVLTGLTELTLTGNAGLTDITPLVSCTKLTTLYLDDTGVTDVSPLQNLPALQNLHLDRCALSDITQLHSITSLKSLYIIDCGITADALTALQQALPNCTVYAGDVTAE